MYGALRRTIYAAYYMSNPAYRRKISRQLNKGESLHALKRDGLTVESMRRSGRRIDDEVLAHISPAHSENINFFGSIDVDIEGELAQLGPTGYRGLRVRDTLF